MVAQPKKATLTFQPLRPHQGEQAAGQFRIELHEICCDRDGKHLESTIGENVGKPLDINRTKGSSQFGQPVAVDAGTAFSQQSGSQQLCKSRLRLSPPVPNQLDKGAVQLGIPANSVAKELGELIQLIFVKEPDGAG